MMKRLMIGTNECPVVRYAPGMDTPRVSNPTHDHAPRDAGATRAPYRRSLADDLLATDVTLVTVQKLLDHAHVQTMAQYDR